MPLLERSICLLFARPLPLVFLEFCGIISSQIHNIGTLGETLCVNSSFLTPN